MFIFILRVLVIYWILSILIRWFSRLGSSGKSAGTVDGKRQNTNIPADINHSGKIDDAEFEEIDRE